VYVVVLEDRHIDVQVLVFADQHEAIEQAKNLALNGAKSEDRIEELQDESWLYCAYYSSEGDYVTVVEREIQ
jgi:hypothetical protein